MYHRRRPHSTSALPPPSNSALVAASTVYHPSTTNPSPSLAAAAAGAALRHASASPTPMDQRTGSIPTKRMLKRRDSYSSVISDSDGGVSYGATGRPVVQRAGSSGSLTGRRFRKDRFGAEEARRGGEGSVEVERRGSADVGGERPSAPTPRAAAGATGSGTGRKRNLWDREDQQEVGEGESSGEYAADDSGSEGFGGVGFGRTTSLRSNDSSTRSFPTTLRGPLNTRKHQKSASTSIFNRAPRDTSSSSSGDGHRRRNSDSDIHGPKRGNIRTLHKPPPSTGGIARLSLGDYGDSVNSLSPSELESIAENSYPGGRLRKVPTKILEEDSDDGLWGEGGSDTFDFQKKGAGGKTRNIGIQNRTGRSASSPPHLLVPTPADTPRNTSPSRAKFTTGGGILETTPPKHSPPPRSVSPAKSALKHIPGTPTMSAAGFGKAPSDAASGRKVRVSFSDEDSIASFMAYSRPPLLGMPDDGPRRLPVFGSVSRGVSGPGVSNTPRHTVLAPSPPPSDSSQESIIGLESALRYPKGQPPLGAAVAVKKLLGVDGNGEDEGAERIRLRKGPLTPPETRAGVPELKLTAPTPGEEKHEVDGALGGLMSLEGLPGGFPGGYQEEEYDPGVIVGNAGGQERAKEDEDEDSDGSGNSIYSDAHEDLTALTTTNLPGILEVVPLSAVRQRNDSSSSASGLPQPVPKPSPPAQLDDLPLPPDFLIPKTTTRRRAQSTPVHHHYSASSSSSSTISFSSGDDTASVLSESSFRRTRPRKKRTGMMTSMRTPPPQLTKSNTSSTGGMRSSLRTGGGGSGKSKSRFSADSDSEEDTEVRRRSSGFKSRFERDSDDELPVTGGIGFGGKLRRSRTDSGDTVKKTVKKGFWGKMLKRRKKREGKGKGWGGAVGLGGMGDVLTLAEEKETASGKGKGVILKNPKQASKGGAWAEDADGVKSVIPTGSNSAAMGKELGLGKEVGASIEGPPVIGYLKKRKRFWRLRRLLGLED